jgi:hypothetical protein
MKLKKYIYGVALGALSLTYASCYNADREFSDYEGGTTAYFAYQYPVRTLILGNDIYDNSLDNAHKCRIWATMGGAYSGRDAVVNFEVDESLCNYLWFVDGGGNPSYAVTPMPKSYYTLASSVIPYNGDSRGYVEVQFTDAFFNDPKSIENTYVIPLRMTKATGIDHILTGTPRVGTTPSRTNLEYWEVLAKDYVLYCVKYMNPWQAKYIRRGVDNVTEKTNTDNPVTTVNVRKDFSLVNTDLEHYTENPVNQYDEICGITTKNMTQSIFPVSFKTSNGTISCNLILTFDKNNKCTIDVDQDGKDAGIIASGSGEFITGGTADEKYKDYRWGSMNGQPVNRDILRLDYKVDFTDQKVKVATADTMVVQTRESNKKVFFTPKYDETYNPGN